MQRRRDEEMRQGGKQEARGGGESSQSLEMCACHDAGVRTSHRPTEMQGLDDDDDAADTRNEVRGER